MPSRGLAESTWQDGSGQIFLLTLKMESTWMTHAMTTCISEGFLDSDAPVWFAVLGAMILAGIIGIVLVRRMALGKYKIKTVSPLEQLQELREKGLITKQEYDQGRRAALGLYERSPADGNVPLPPAPGTRR
jgi:hypothetical protein